MAKVWGICAITGLFVFVALLSHRGEALVLAVPFLLYLGYGLLSAPGTPSLEASRAVNKQVIRTGSPVQISVEISNPLTPLNEVLLAHHLPARLKVVEGDSSWFTTMPAGAKISGTFSIRGTRGRYDLGDISVSAGDHFGLFRVETTIPLKTIITILPETLPLERVVIRPRQTRGFAGPIPSRSGGSGISFYDIRQYQMGDPLRRINWRISARQQQNLFTNDYEVERIADVGLIVDARLQSDLTIPSSEANRFDSLFEYSAQAAASLASVLLAEGNRVGLLVFGYGIERVIPGYGRNQQERILRTLARVRTGHNYSLENFSNLPTRLFPPKSQLIIVSPLQPGDIHALIHMKASGYDLIVISPDPIAFEKSHLADQPNIDVAESIARVERSLIIKRLARLEVPVVEWNVRKSFSQVIETGLNRRSSIHHRTGGY